MLTTMSVHNLFHILNGISPNSPNIEKSNRRYNNDGYFFVILNMLLYRFFAIGIFPRRYAKDL